MKLNSRGSSFVDVLVGMAILMVTLSLMFQFLTFLKANTHKQDINIMVFQTLHNESERAYRTEVWTTLTGEVYSTPKGDVISTFSDYRITEYNTEHVLLEISIEDFTQSISLERSVFWNE